MNRATHHVRVLVLPLLFVAACSDSPESVCDHPVELMKAAGAPELDRSACVADMARTKERKNFIQWMRFSSCVTELDNMDGMKQCTALLDREPHTQVS